MLLQMDTSAVQQVVLMEGLCSIYQQYLKKAMEQWGTRISGNSNQG